MTPDAIDQFKSFVRRAIDATITAQDAGVTREAPDNVQADLTAALAYLQSSITNLQAAKDVQTYPLEGV